MKKTSKEWLRATKPLKIYKARGRIVRPRVYMVGIEYIHKKEGSVFWQLIGINFVLSSFTCPYQYRECAINFSSNWIIAFHFFLTLRFVLSHETAYSILRSRTQLGTIGRDSPELGRSKDP